MRSRMMKDLLGSRLSCTRKEREDEIDCMYSSKVCHEIDCFFLTCAI